MLYTYFNISTNQLCKNFKNSKLLQLTATSDFAPASSKEFLDIQATIECGFTLKRVRDMIRTYSQFKNSILCTFFSMLLDNKNISVGKFLMSKKVKI